MRYEDGAGSRASPDGTTGIMRQLVEDGPATAAVAERGLDSGSGARAVITWMPTCRILRNSFPK